MHRRQPQTLPRIWLMTDERQGGACQGDGLADALQRLPKGGGIIFRHYGLPHQQRVALFAKVKRIARKRRQILLQAGPLVGRADGRHGIPTTGLWTAPVHNVRERIAAERSGAALLFASPVYATRSHPGSVPLGRVRFGMLIRGAKTPVIALGGMDQKRAKCLKLFNIYGWAAIDAFTNQKRTDVPT
jgi:thiamine-phosphate pyrophosphorylase